MDYPLTPDERDLWRILEGMAGGDAILDFIPIVSPDLGGRGRVLRPNHLKPVADAIARARMEPVRICISTAPRFSKSETVSHGLAWLLMLDDEPETEMAYCTYAAELAHQRSRSVQEICRRAGVPLAKNKQPAHLWKTRGGVQFRAVGVGGPLTGMGAKYLIIDDPCKNREDAESRVMRQKTWDWFTSTALTRVAPGGSVIVVSTRWHADDMIGRIQEGQAGEGWEFFDLPAILDEGTPNERSLWPERWPLEELWQKRALMGGKNSYDWSSLFMGNPQPKGGKLFQNPKRIDRHDRKQDTWYVIGCDPAATESTASDYSAIVVLAVRGRMPNIIMNPYKADPGATAALKDFSCEVVDVWREKVRIPELVAKLQQLGQLYRAPVVIEAVGGFKAVPQMLRQVDKGLRIFEITPTKDKFTRAQPVAAAWNAGMIGIPLLGNWSQQFLSEVDKFTGIKDAYDDQVDALSHAFNAIQVCAPQFRGMRRPGWREI